MDELLFLSLSIHFEIELYKWYIRVYETQMNILSKKNLRSDLRMLNPKMHTLKGYVENPTFEKLKDFVILIR